MNAVATINQPTRLERFIGDVLPSHQRDEFYSVLPRHISAGRFERALSNVLMNTPDLMNCDPRLIFREISKVVGLGLLLDPQLGEAYLILAWNGKTKQKEPQARVGYKGLIKLAKQSGEILNIYAREVHARDEIECLQGDENRLIHKPLLFTDRGPIVGYYAVVKYRNGEIDFEPMSVKQVHEIRDRSDGWKAFSAGKIQSTPWSTDEVEMSKKTVFRRITKRITQSPDLNEAIAIEDKAEFQSFSGRSELPPPAPRRQIASEAPRQIDHDPSRDTGRAGEPSPVQDAEAEDAGAPGPQASASDPAHDEDHVVTMESLLTELDERLGFAKTTDDVEEAYTDFDAEPIFSDYEGGVEKARALKTKHLERVPAPKADKPATADGSDFPGNAAIEKAHAGKDPFAIPERFKGGGHYQIFIRGACNAAITQEHEDRLRLIWAQTKPQRDGLAEAGQIDKVTVKILLDGLKETFGRIQAGTAERPMDELPPPAPRAQKTQEPQESAEIDEAPAAPKAASGDPVAAYDARMSEAFAAAKTKEEVDQFWFGTVDERDTLGASDDQRSKWKIARSKAKNALPSEEA